MAKKYVATIMDRHYLGDDFFIFSVNHTVIGEIDEETKIFKDRNGNEFCPMLDNSLLMSEIPYAYTNIIELSKIREEMGDSASLAEALGEYEYRCRQAIYIVGRTEDRELFYV